MTKTAYNFKFSDERDAQLDDLARVYGKTRTGMLESLIAAAHAAQFGPPLPAPVDGAELVEYLKAAPGHPARGK